MAILVAVLSLTGIYAFGQRPKVHSSGKSSYTRERYNANATRVSRQKARIVCPIFVNSKYPYHGIGVKLGDPFALTYKFYPNKNWGIVVDAGKASSGLYNRYYRKKFDEYTDYSTEVRYGSHRVRQDYVGEIKILYHIDASRISPGLQVYGGFGWEFKKTRLQYSFTYTNQNPNTGGNGEIDRLYRERFTQGPQAVAGIEYSYFHIPISAFMEVEYFQDVAADPGWKKFEGGVGLRYIF